MFLIRPTQSLAKNLNVSITKVESNSSQSTALQEWYCNNFKFSRTDLVIFVNSETYFPLILKAAPYRDLVDRFSTELPAYLTKLGYPSLAPEPSSEVVYAKTSDRSVLGVMSQFIKELEAEDYLGRIQPDEIWTMTNRLADTLIGGPNYKTPLERLAEMSELPKTSTKACLKAERIKL